VVEFENENEIYFKQKEKNLSPKDVIGFAIMIDISDEYF
jgi:hypothetical protein